MAQLHENIDSIVAAFYMCARSDGNCSPLSREELRQVIEQEFEDAMEVRTEPAVAVPSGCRAGIGHAAGWLKACTPMDRTPGSLGKAQMPSKPRICREEEKLFILPVPAACRARYGEQQKPQ